MTDPLDAYTIAKFSQQNVRTIIQPVGSAYPIDPLDQYGEIGWKASMVAEFLEPLDEIEEATMRWLEFLK